MASTFAFWRDMLRVSEILPESVVSWAETGMPPMKCIKKKILHNRIMVEL